MDNSHPAPEAASALLSGVQQRELLYVATLLAAAPLIFIFIVPKLVAAVGWGVGLMFRKKTEGRRAHLVTVMSDEDNQYSKQNKASLSTSTEILVSFSSENLFANLKLTITH